MAKTSGNAEHRSAAQHLSSVERRKLKKIAVEKQRRARMNRALTAMRELLQQEDGQLDDADTSQVLDLAVHFLRSCQRTNPTSSTHPTPPTPACDVRDATSSRNVTSRIRTAPIVPIPHINSGHPLLSDLDLQRLVDYQNQLDRANLWEEARRGVGYDVTDAGLGRHPEGLVLRHLDQAVREGPYLLQGIRGPVWRPW